MRKVAFYREQLINGKSSNKVERVKVGSRTNRRRKKERRKGGVKVVGTIIALFNFPGFKGAACQFSTVPVMLFKSRKYVNPSFIKPYIKLSAIFLDRRKEGRKEGRQGSLCYEVQVNMNRVRSEKSLIWLGVSKRYRKWYQKNPEHH